MAQSITDHATLWTDLDGISSIIFESRMKGITAFHSRPLGADLRLHKVTSWLFDGRGFEQLPRRIQVQCLLTN